MIIGRVKFFNDIKGYGFIEGEGGADVFVHFSVIEAEPGAYRSLNVGDTVEYEVESTPKGLQAEFVRRIGPIA